MVNGMSEIGELYHCAEFEGERLFGFKGGVPGFGLSMACRFTINTLMHAKALRFRRYSPKIVDFPLLFCNNVNTLKVPLISL